MVTKRTIPRTLGGSEFRFCVVVEGMLISRLHLGPLRAIKDDYDAEFAANSDSLAYFAKSCMASSASTPPVMEIGTKGAFAAISALEIMI